MKPTVLVGVIVVVAVAIAIALKLRRRDAESSPVDEAAAALKLPVSSTRVGDCTIRSLISTDPYASLYAATAADGTAVTVKLPARASLQDADELKRFEREAEMLESIGHPGIIRLVSRGRVDERASKVPYMVLERLEGLGFAAFLAERAPVEPAEAIEILRQIASALEVIHKQEIIHRNLGPEALQVLPDGRVVLHSFGVARAAAMQTITMQGQVVGSVEYMAPEQMAGKKIDGKVDLYAVGVLGYQLLSGKSPFAHAGIAALMKQKSELEGPHVSKVNPAVPAALDRLLSQLMSSDPGRRPANATRVVSELASLG